MKILFFTRALTVGGSERQLALLAGGLSERGHDVAIAVLYAGGALQKSLAGRNVRILSLGKSGRWDIVRPFLRLVRLFVAERPDVVYAYLPTQTVLAALLLPPWLPTRIVFGIRAAGMDLTKYDWLSAVVTRLEARLSRRADLVISNSEAGRANAVNRGMPARRITVVPNGIDTALLKPDRHSGQEFRRRLGLPESCFLIGLVARLDPMKDHATFLTAAAEFARGHPDARFLCVGDGPFEYRRRLEARAVELGLADRIRWAGERLDVGAAYNALDIATLCSSFGEGFSNVIGEAMACGVPVVATDVGDARSIIGDCGEIVPPKRPDLLQSAWARLRRRLSEESQQLSARARTRIVDHYSLELMISRSETALAEIGKPD
jgi:glycosyltransferase involved in cell wall biosynthesis